MTAKFQRESSSHVEEGLTDLKSLRESRGLTLDNVTRATKISLRNLEAIESGNFHSLPPPVYARAYFHAYAKMLDIDEGPFIGRYERYLATASQASKAQADELPGQKVFSPKKLLIQVAGVAVVGVLAFLIFVYFNDHRAVVTTESAAPLNTHVDSTTDTPAPAQPDMSAPMTGAGSGGDSSPQAEKTLPEPAGQLPPAGPKDETRAEAGGISPQELSVLIITAREETWLRIKEDDAPPYQLLMHPGEQVSRSASRYALDIGNAGGVSLEFQGQPMKELGKSGQVVHLQLP